MHGQSLNTHSQARFVKDRHCAKDKDKEQAVAPLGISSLHTVIQIILEAVEVVEDRVASISKSDREKRDRKNLRAWCVFAPSDGVKCQ